MLSYEEIYRGMKNKEYLLMCGISQFSNLPVVGGIFFIINILLKSCNVCTYSVRGSGVYEHSVSVGGEGIHRFTLVLKGQ
jgi:hypothetical protein